MAAEDPAVSVVIPTYCEEATIKDCLMSVKKQRFEVGGIEIIVVDSNSPDQTRVISKEYADKVVNTKERGVSKARNLGADKAKGELLIFLDGDTILDPKCIMEIYKSFYDPKVVYVSGAILGLERPGLKETLSERLHYNLMNNISLVTAQIGFPFFPTVCCACRKTVFQA